jgi:DNA-binding MarR family transcriptional regulator
MVLSFADPGFAANPATRLAKLDLTKAAYRVYFLLEEVLDEESWIGITQADVAAQLKMKPVVVSEALAELERAELLERNPESLHSWRLRAFVPCAL